MRPPLLAEENARIGEAVRCAQVVASMRPPLLAEENPSAHLACRSGPCFNEASAVSGGKLIQTSELAYPLAPASMRPPLLAEENIRTLTCCRRRAASFNEASAVSGGKHIMGAATYLAGVLLQ